jgi:photosystem II stability/assembly factor-like uncharacterized protein
MTPSRRAIAYLPMLAVAVLASLLSASCAQSPRPAPASSEAALRAVSADATWTVHRTGTGIDFNSVCFADDKAGWVVGGNAILRTTDGGKNWARHTVATANILWSVDFVDPQNGWAAAAGEHDGHILHTSDGGITWAVQSSEPSAGFSSVFFIDTNRGWAVGAKNNEWAPPEANSLGLILATSDGGRTWRRQLSPPVVQAWGPDVAGRTIIATPGGPWSDEYVGRLVKGLSSVYFVDARTGYAAGNDCNIVKTEDGGTTWKRQVCPAGGSVNLRSIFFVDASRGWAVGDSVVMSTTNGGKTWVPHRLPARSLASVYFADARHGWVVGGAGEGDTGVIFATSDGGRSWTSQTPNVGKAQVILNAIGRSPSGVWAVGKSATPPEWDSSLILQR